MQSEVENKSPAEIFVVTDGVHYAGSFHKGYIAQSGYDPRYDAFASREEAEKCLATMAKYYVGMSVSVFGGRNDCVDTDAHTSGKRKVRTAA